MLFKMNYNTVQSFESVIEFQKCDHLNFCCPGCFEFVNNQMKGLIYHVINLHLFVSCHSTPRSSCTVSPTSLWPSAVPCQIPTGCLHICCCCSCSSSCSGGGSWSESDADYGSPKAHLSANCCCTRSWRYDWHYCFCFGCPGLSKVAGCQGKSLSTSLPRPATLLGSCLEEFTFFQKIHTLLKKTSRCLYKRHKCNTDW